jgi:hypothetical protein
LPPDYLEKLDPGYVTPLVLYLCSEACSDSGLVLNAGMGFYSRTAVVNGPGVVLGEGGQMPTTGDIHKSWSEIEQLEGGQEYENANAALMDMLTGHPEHRR